MTRDVWHAAVGALLFHEAGRRLVHRYRVYKDPFPHPALRDGVIPRLLSCVCRAMAIAQLTHLKISILKISVVGGSSGSGACRVFSGRGGTPLVPQPRRRHVSFTDEVTMPGEEDSPECSQVVPPLILPVVVEEVIVVLETECSEEPSLILLVVEELNSGTPVVARVDMVPSMMGSGLPPPPGFSPFIWPVDDGGMDVYDLCAQISGDCSLILSPISRESLDLWDAMDSPEVGVLISPLEDSSSEVTPAVGYARLPLPSVDNSLIPDLVWVPALPQSTGQYVDRECPVPRWRLAREGPFLEERSPESIRSLGPGCTFRNTMYRASDYAAPVVDYGFPLHHPRFVEWIGVPQSARLIEFSSCQWVDKLSWDQAVTAAVHLQRDVLDQYALSLQKAASRMIDNCLGPCVYPGAEVVACALGPRIRRAAVQMEGMGLWRPSLDPLRLH